jgi:hypothetical protein
MAGSSTHAAAGDTVGCPQCGAAVPVRLSPTVRCLFCAAEVEIPDDVLQVLDKDDVLDRAAERIEAQTAALVQHSPFGTWVFILPPFALAIVMGGGSIGVAGYQWMQNELTNIQLLQAGLSTALLIAVPSFAGTLIAVGIWYQRSPTAPLPMAIPQWTGPDKHLSAQCYRCGASLCPKAGAITARCDGCSSPCLLPAALVDHHLRKKHHKVVRAHRAYLRRRIKLGGEGLGQGAPVQRSTGTPARKDA